MSASRFALGLALRAIIIAVLTYSVVQVLATGHLYATAVVIMAIGALLLFELTGYIARGDRLLARFVSGIAAEDFDLPPRQASVAQDFQHLREAIDHSSAALGSKRAARQEKLDYLNSLIDNVSAALFMVDSDGAIAFANRAAHRLATSHDRRLQDCSALGTEAAERLLEIPAGGRNILRLANGQRVLASVAVVATAKDRQRLISLENINSELDAVELKAWQDLVRILSHEMMNSLTPITALAAGLRPLIAKQVTHPADVDAAIEAIARRSSGLMSFIERYRKMADLPAPLLQQTKLADLLQRIENLLSATFESRGITYTRRLEREDLTLRIDPELVEQALINLLHNAEEAVAGVASPSIEVRCTIEEERLLIAIADNGKGFDPENLERLFVPFFTTKPGGSGIGLSLARQIALAHGGQLDVSANPPRGAAFVLNLPLNGSRRSGSATSG